MSTNVIIAIECLSVFIMLTRWSRRYASGEYDTADAPPVFFAHLLMGLLPLVAVAYLLGQHLHRRDVARLERLKAAADAEREVDRTLEGR